ncbi:MAG: hypothetical protein SFX73_00410 [Kofleriaceae bacterium]|nr:hypothetical protein [Kofleriaceae bacterium]
MAPTTNPLTVPVPASGANTDQEPDPMWGSMEAGEGFLVGRTKLGELSISAYALVRYINQLPAGQTYLDHLGRERNVDPRHDIWAHRLMIHLKGWLWSEKLRYQITLWGLNTTDQDATFGVIGYQFHKAFNLYGGLNGLPGSRSLQGSHPFWLGHDRVMADEFFRPYFTHGVWASGEVLLPGLWYQVMVGDSLSSLGINATQITRNFAYAASVWWMPTTYEFGPNGSFDDYEWHEEPATRFGISGTTSKENRFADNATSIPENTTIRLADAVNLFEFGSLAEGVQLEDARYSMMSVDAGVKYKGVFIGASYFARLLSEFVADGPLPVERLIDTGFYLQASFYPLKQKLQLYAVTSWVFGDKDAGFQTQHEYLGGANWFFGNTRNLRMNAQVIRVDRSPVSSNFGYYAGGQDGVTTSLAVSVLF